MKAWAIIFPCEEQKFWSLILPGEKSFLHPLLPFVESYLLMCLCISPAPAFLKTIDLDFFIVQSSLDLILWILHFHICNHLLVCCLISPTPRLSCALPLSTPPSAFVYRGVKVLCIRYATHACVLVQGFVYVSLLLWKIVSIYFMHTCSKGKV